MLLAVGWEIEGMDPALQSNGAMLHRVMHKIACGLKRERGFVLLITVGHILSFA